MMLLIMRRLHKHGRDRIEPFLFSRFSKKSIPVTRLGFTGKGLEKILLGL